MSELFIQDPHLNDDLISLLTRFIFQCPNTRKTLLNIGSIYVSMKNEKPSLPNMIDFNFVQSCLK